MRIENTAERARYDDHWISGIRRVIPARLRRQVRGMVQEAPYRLHDLLPDLVECAGLKLNPLPPPALRRRVSGKSSRRHFLDVGGRAAASIQRVFEMTRDPTAQYHRWLDFGCGPGRVGRFLSQSRYVPDLWGVDIDREAVGWASRHLSGRFLAINPEPPTPLSGEFFDVVFAGSVFTHLDELLQNIWLAEVHRVLRSGGLFIATTHSPRLSYARPDLSAAQRTELSMRGFVFASGNASFNEDSAFHSNDYLVAEWGRLFGLLRFEEHGLDGYQDLTVWRKW